MTTKNIHDVAALAGVSIATVSHVINKTRYVSEKTTNKVLYAMNELKYRPNHAARSLRSTKTSRVGLIIPVHPGDTSRSFFMTIAEGIEETLRPKGFHVIMSNSKENVKNEVEQLQLLDTHVTDGIILASTCEALDQLKPYLKDDHPCVLIDRVPEGYTNDFVRVNTYDVTIEAINGLKKRGYKKIGFVGSTHTVSTTRERMHAFQRATLDDPFSPNRIFLRDPTYEEGYNLAKHLLNSDVDVVFFSSNILATGVLHYLSTHQIQIPEQLALIVFDNTEWTRIHSPTITVIEQPAFQLGVEAATCFLNRIEHPDSKAMHIDINPTIIWRNSC